MMLYGIRSGLIALLLACLCGLLSSAALAEQPFRIDRFISSDTCKDCHTQIAEEWEQSMHHLAHKDPVYNRLAQFLRKGLTDAGEIEEAESCVKCHTPLGVVSGFPKKLTDDLSKTPEIATNGVQCDLCHSTVDVSKMYNNGLVLEPGQGEDEPGVKQGPFDDCEPDFHEARFSKLHTRSEICGTCHDVNHVAFGTPLETTYTEWKNSPYNSKDPETHISCQGCHMYQRPGIPATGSTDRPDNPGSMTDYSEERPHLFTHYFVGGNAYVPDMYGSEEKAGMAKERLANAALVKIDPDMLKSGKLKVVVSNTGAGHSIPTGLADLRQVWLEIIIRDKANAVVFSSGRLDSKQLLSEDAIVFRTVFGDGKGNKIINISKAHQVLSDNRIKAGESRTVEIDLKGRKLVEGDLVEVRLLYRSASQKVLNLIPDADFDPLPVIEMASDMAQL